MGKKRTVEKVGGEADGGKRNRLLSKVPKRKLAKGILHIRATYNNTSLTLLMRISVSDTSQIKEPRVFYLFCTF